MLFTFFFISSSAVLLIKNDSSLEDARQLRVGFRSRCLALCILFVLHNYIFLWNLRVSALQPACQRQKMAPDHGKSTGCEKYV